jgi:SAM-dependent methyltransferase
MIRRAEEQRRRTKLDIEFLDLPGERIPLEESSVDTVVSTFTLCLIPGVGDAIQGIARVLKPGGKFIFFEHGLAPDHGVRRWQDKDGTLISLGIRGLSRHPRHPDAHPRGRIQYRTDGHRLLAPFPKSGSHCFWGIARPELR